MRQFGLFTALCLSLAACSASRISDAIGDHVKTTKAVDLQTVGAEGWDRVCVLGPYSTDRGAQETIGFSWPVESRSAIAWNDGISLLLFVREQHVVHAVEHPRDRGDFSELSGRCFLPDEAQFIRRNGEGDEWPHLAPRNGA